MKHELLFIAIWLLAITSGCESDWVSYDDDREFDINEIAQHLELSSYQLVLEETAVDDTAIKDLEVFCPEGKKALSAGWSVLDETSAILTGRATYFQSQNNGDSYRVVAENDAAYQPYWKLRLRVVCVAIDGPDGISGYQIVKTKSKRSTEVSKTVHASCPYGKVATHTGWAAKIRRGTVVPGLAEHSLPSLDGKNWSIGVTSDTTKKWRLKAKTICIDDATLGYGVILEETISDTFSRKQLKTYCPDGKFAVGTGWGVLDPQDATIEGWTLYNQIAYNGSNWMINARPEQYGVDWKLQMRLICID